MIYNYNVCNTFFRLVQRKRMCIGDAQYVVSNGTKAIKKVFSAEIFLMYHR